MLNDKFKFNVEPGLQEIYRDKDTGLPLSNGYITYFRDVSRTELKPVYKLSGTPVDPVFVELPNPLDLTQVGSTSDGAGVDTKVYYLPFDDDGNQDLYFIEVRSESGVLQFTREGWPEQINTENTDINFNDIENYIENGQFLMRRLYPVGDNGLLTQETTNLAFAGWIAVLSSAFTSQNSVQFDRFTEDLVIPESGPRYALRMSGTNPNPAESIKDIRKIYNRVNAFSEDTFTLQFESLTNNGISLGINLFYQKNYGTGGSSEVEQFVGSFTVIPDEWNKYKITFTVSDDDGMVFGPDNDDEFRLIFRIDTAVSYDFSMTNIMMVLGEFSNDLSYPVTSDYQAISKTLAGSMDITDTDNSDIGSVLTLSERTNTTSADTGQPIATLAWKTAVPTGSSMEWWTDTAPDGFFLMDGTTYDIIGTSANEQASNLWGVIGNVGGRGEDSFYIDYSVIDEVSYTSWLAGVVIAPDPHTSGFTINTIDAGDPGTRAIIQVITEPASSISSGSYFELFAPTGRSTVYWFRKDGLGTAPSFPGSLVQPIDITSGDSADLVSTKLGQQGTTQIVVPDRRGYFTRAVDNGAGRDPDAADRIDSTGFDIIGDVVGSIQIDTLQDHQHRGPVNNGGDYLGFPGGTLSLDSGSGGATFGSTGLVDTTIPVDDEGRVSAETRPINIYCNYIMKN